MFKFFAKLFGFEESELEKKFKEKYKRNPTIEELGRAKEYQIRNKSSDLNDDLFKFMYISDNNSSSSNNSSDSNSSSDSGD